MRDTFKDFDGTRDLQDKPFASLSSVEGTNANVTTCDFGVPHYHINARDLDAYRATRNAQAAASTLPPEP